MKDSKIILLSFFLGILVLSCNSDKQRLFAKINTSWKLLDAASNQKEAYLSVPLGFKLGCTSDEFERHCDTLVKKMGGENHHFTWNSGYTGVTDTYLNTNVFGGVKKQVTIPHDNYVNPKIKNINKITFRFTEFQLNRELDGGWKTFRDSISSKFDESWKTIAFDLRYIDAHDDLPYDTWETN